jgi:hypothetical protein
LLLFACVIGLLVGFFWYWIWFAQRGAGIWYLAGVTFIVGIGLLSAAAWFRDAEGNLLLSGAVVVQIPLCGLLLYGVWRLVRFLVTRLFSVLLIGIAQAGAAWRGELPK